MWEADWYLHLENLFKCLTSVTQTDISSISKFNLHCRYEAEANSEYGDKI